MSKVLQSTDLQLFLYSVETTGEAGGQKDSFRKMEKKKRLLCEMPSLGSNFSVSIDCS